MNINSPTKQLTLSVHLNTTASFENFYGEANQKIKLQLSHIITDQTETLTYLIGGSGTGKSHLAVSAISFAESLGRTAGYFCMKDLHAALQDPESADSFFYDIRSYSFLVLDNYDCLFQHKPIDNNSVPNKSINARERGLFNLFNHFKMSDQQLVLSGQTVPSRCSVDLQDLASRLNSGLLLSLTPLTDLQKEQLLQNIAKQKGFTLDDSLSAFIIKRSGRDLGALLSVLEELEQASLIEKRKLSVPFAKKILNW